MVFYPRGPEDPDGTFPQLGLRNLKLGLQLHPHQCPLQNASKLAEAGSPAGQPTCLAWMPYLSAQHIANQP